MRLRGMSGQTFVRTECRNEGPNANVSFTPLAAIGTAKVTREPNPTSDAAQTHIRHILWYQRRTQKG